MIDGTDHYFNRYYAEDDLDQHHIEPDEDWESFCDEVYCYGYNIVEPNDVRR